MISYVLMAGITTAMIKMCCECVVVVVIDGLIMRKSLVNLVGRIIKALKSCSQRQLAAYENCDTKGKKSSHAAILYQLNRFQHRS